MNDQYKDGQVKRPGDFNLPAAFHHYAWFAGLLSSGSWRCRRLTPAVCRKRTTQKQSWSQEQEGGWE